MFGMKSLWPGESKNTTLLSFIVIFRTPISIVTPLALSYSVESVTQASLKLSFPIILDYFSFLCTSLLSINAASFINTPSRVDLPESTCPTTTTLIVLEGDCLALPIEGYSLL